MAGTKEERGQGENGTALKEEEWEIAGDAKSLSKTNTGSVIIKTE
jgi:hypothetical protein